MQINTRYIVILLIIAFIGVVAALLLIPPLLYTSQQGVKNYLRTHPEDVAIACLDPRRPLEAFYRNADETYPLAATFDLVLLAAYAQEVAAGRLAAEETIPFEALNAWYLPNTDAGAHPEFLKTLGEGRATLTLDEAVSGMLIYSSNAAADYLLSRLSAVDFDDLYRRLELEHSDLPFSTLGLYLVMNNHEQGALKSGAYPAETIAARRLGYEQAFINDPAWRQAELAYTADISHDAPLNIQKWFTSIYGQGGSARDMAHILRAAYGYSEALTPEAQAIMRRQLEWPLRMNPDEAHNFKTLASKSGAWPATLSAAWYAENEDGQPLILVVLYANLRDDYWNTWLSSFTHQEFETDLLRNADCSVFIELFDGASR